MTSNYLEILRKMVLDSLRDEKVSIALFGSFASGDNTVGSDVDIAVIPKVKLDRWKLAELRDRLAESSAIPFKVDLVDFSRVSEKFRTHALENAVWWRK